MQRRWATEDAGGGLRAEGLDALPNALEAEYWLRKAAAEEAAGRPEVGGGSGAPAGGLVSCAAGSQPETAGGLGAMPAGA